MESSIHYGDVNSNMSAEPLSDSLEAQKAGMSNENTEFAEVADCNALIIYDRKESCLRALKLFKKLSRTFFGTINVFEDVIRLDMLEDYHGKRLASKMAETAMLLIIATTDRAIFSAEAKDWLSDVIKHSDGGLAVIQLGHPSYRLYCVHELADFSGVIYLKY